VSAGLAALLSGACVASGAVASQSSGGASRAKGSPNIIQLSYGESSDQGADRRLEAFASHTHGMHFATTYMGKKASAPGKYNSHVTDTDIHGRKARHPWEPDRKKGGGDVVRLVHKALHGRGVARVRLRARKSGEVDKARVRIDRDKCASDPPLYPLTCEVKVD
jgi:hypothetical protein